MIRNSMVGKSSPWGKIDHETQVAEGIVKVSTAGHGGYKLDRKRNQQVPEYMRIAGGWYEEDVDWCIVAIVYSQFFSNKVLEAAEKTLLYYKPEGYARHHNVPLESLAGKSHVYDERLWLEQHANDFIVVSAWCGTHGPFPIPEGMVGVKATISGHRDVNRDDGRYFLVPLEEYQQRSKFGFVIDPNRHQVWGD